MLSRDWGLAVAFFVSSALDTYSVPYRIDQSR